MEKTGRHHNPKARGKIEAFFNIMYRKLVSLVVFSDLDHAQLELSGDRLDCTNRKIFQRDEGFTIIGHMR